MAYCYIYGEDFLRIADDYALRKYSYSTILFHELFLVAHGNSGSYMKQCKWGIPTSPHILGAPNAGLYVVHHE
jgi:hypothetical protein